MNELDTPSGHNTEDASASKISLVRRQLPFLTILALATSLVLLILLVLGTFVAGVHLLSLQIGFL